MIYQFDSRVRYSEVDMQQRLTLNGIINYFQDCSTFHSEYIGLGIGHLAQQDRAWILSSWQIVIDRLPKFREKITVQTWPYNFKAFYGSRNFALLDERGNRIVSANSLWVFMDTKSGRPVKIAADQLTGYEMEEKLDMEYAERKIMLPQEATEKERFSVLKHQLDTNNHVNNGQYVQMAHEFLADDFRLRQMRAEYKKAALLHDVIVPWVHTEEGNCTVSLCDETGKPYAVIAFDE